MLEVSEGSPAAAGLQVGDVILEMAGVTATSLDGPISSLTDKSIGRSSPLRIVSGGQIHSATIEPAEMEWSQKRATDCSTGTVT